MEQVRINSNQFGMLRRSGNYVMIVKLKWETEKLIDCNFQNIKSLDDRHFRLYRYLLYGFDLNERKSTNIFIHIR